MTSTCGDPDTRCPNMISIRWAARSVGTFPNAVNATAAVLRTGPKLTELTCPPAGGHAVVVVPQAQCRRGNRYSVRHRITFTSQTCDQAVPAEIGRAHV